jgi:plastocyanin
MPCISMRTHAAIALALLAAASSGCGRGGETFGAGEHLTDGQTRQKANDLHSASDADASPTHSVASMPRAAETSATESAENRVAIDNFTFAPQTLSVSVGTPVVWLNRDDVPHSIVSDDKLFKSPLLDTDEKFSFTFTKPGEYSYYCGIHPHMTGKIVVK